MLADPGYKFCPKCGSPLSLRRLKEFEPERLVCQKCDSVLYLNPKVAAGAVVDYEGGIVLLRREIEPRAGYWVHPGGFVDRGETLEAAARRETREEVGLEVEIGRLLGAYSFANSDVVVVTFAARTISGAPIVGDESLEVKTFSPDELPWDKLAFPSTHFALQAYLAAGEEGFRRPAPRSSPSASGAGPESAVLAALDEARAEALAAKDVRAASLVYPTLVGLLRDERRFREALRFAEEGLALTHDPYLARLADEVADQMAASEQERC